MKEIFGNDQYYNFIIENIKNIKNNSVICLYYGAEWCTPCKELKKRLNETETNNIMPKLVVGYLDISDESNEKLVNKFKVRIFPTLFLIKLDKNNYNNIKIVSKIEGYDFTKLQFEYNDYLK